MNFTARLMLYRALRIRTPILLFDFTQEPPEKKSGVKAEVVWFGN